MAFQKAIKARAKGRVSLAGPSGSGKTYTALSIAKHMGGKIAVLDTEHGSASKYADLFDFDVMELEAPYHPDKYVQAIQDAGKAGYDVLIIDSLSHAWFGKGGLLELVDQFAKKNGGGNSYAGWKDATPIQNRMIEAMLSSSPHLIVTMRSKQEYVLEQNDKGKTVPRKVGMAPIQRDGMEYEFDVFAELDLDHNLMVSKSRCPQLDGAFINKAGKEFADTFTNWLTGADPVSVPKAGMPGAASPALPPALEAIAEPLASDYEGKYSEYPITFGKHKGKTLKSFTEEQLTVMLNTEKLMQDWPELKKAITAHLEPLPF
jgi:hypothetical protein